MKWKLSAKIAGLLIALSIGMVHSPAPAATAQSVDFYVQCEQGHYNAFKSCEAHTDYVGRRSHQWYGDSGVILDNCGAGRFCSVYCRPGVDSGTVFVNFINRDTGQLLGTASTSIGCRT